MSDKSGSGELDSLDKKILKILSSSSEIRYSELADRLGTSKNTVYRRINGLKERGVIKKDFIKNTSVDVLKFDDIGISTLILAMEFDIDSLDKATDFLNERDEVKLILETFGEYDIIAVVFGEKGKERKLVSKLRQDLKDEEIGLENFEVHTASFKKLDLTVPF